MKKKQIIAESCTAKRLDCITQLLLFLAVVLSKYRFFKNMIIIITYKT